MAAFAWRALRSDGRETRGVIEAESERHARRLLREQALSPLEVQASVARVANRSRTRRGAPRLKPLTVVLFTRLLGALLESGLPLDDALAAIARQSTDPSLRLVVLEIRASVLEGSSLGDAIGRFPDIFPDAYRATVHAGEQTRLLPVVLQRVADYLERRAAVLQKMRLALIYPAVLTGVALLVVGGLLSFVVPQIVSVFEHSDRPLPDLTRALLAVSDGVSRGWPVMLGAVALGVLAWRRAMRWMAFRRRVERI